MNRDELFRTLKRAVTGSFEVLAELGRGPGGRNAYVAREVHGGALVVLELNLEGSDADGTPTFGLRVRRELDASIPTLSLQCDECGASISGWSRYCPNCDRDISGVENTTGGRRADDLMRSGQLGGQDRYELLGEMPRTEGGGAVYFARERTTGRLVTLRVEKEGPGPDAGYTLGATQSMPALPHVDAPTPPRVPRVAWRDADAAAAAKAAPSSATPPVAAPAATTAPWYCPTCGTTFEAGVFFCPRDGTPVKPAVVSDKLIGQTIAGRFRILKKLGSGGMGTVYVAEHVRMGRPCALKIMNQSLKDDAEALGRFAREAAHASRITHPNVAAIYDFGEGDDGTLFLAMEYAEGESLSALMKREGAVAPEHASDIIRQVLDALAAAHALGIVHRDLKPDNIILARTPTGGEAVKVIDFGIAKTMRAESQQLTRSGFVVGTPKYMSPEQITGDKVDGRTDIYSAGCILYELLVGAAPFTGPSGEITITRRLSEPPPHPRRLNRLVGRPLDLVVVRAMGRSPDERFSTAEEFRDALVAAARPDFSGAWAERWAPIARGVTAAGRAGSGAMAGFWRAVQAGARGLARGLGSTARRAGAGIAAAGQGGAAAAKAGASGLGRAIRPVLTWKAAVAVAVLALVGAGGPPMYRWISRPRPPQPQQALQLEPANQVQSGTVAGTPGGATRQLPGPIEGQPDAQPPNQAASQAPAGSASSAGAGPTRPPATASPGAAPTPVEQRGPRPPVASAASGTPPRTVPSSTPSRPTDKAVPPTRAAAAPAPAVLDSIRAKLRLAQVFSEREEYPDAFEQLRLVSGRLASLRSEFPAAESVRGLRAELSRVLTRTTSQCEAVRKIAVDRGERAPACR